MSRRKKLLIYGGNGYSGQLVAEEAMREGIAPIITGRSPQAVFETAKRYGCECRIFDLKNIELAASFLKDVAVVVNCAGPFSKTALPLLQACQEAGAHYLDITGELQVIEGIFAQHNQCKEHGIVAIPGVGFDVVPTDCVAALLKRHLPNATKLRLAFTGTHQAISAGTAKTAIEGVRYGSFVRANGRLTKVPVAWKTALVPFPTHTALAISIPWGDLVTAWMSTRIPNIEVYMETTSAALRRMRLMRFMRWTLFIPGVVKLSQRLAGYLFRGPSVQQRQTGQMSIWGEAENAEGHTVSAVLQTIEAYQLTAKTAVRAASLLYDNHLEPGVYTPSQAFGHDFILTVPGCSYLKRPDTNPAKA